MRKNLALAILIGLLCIALPASAAEDPNIWHVSSGGEEADFTTIRDAMLDDRIMPGDTIVILPGTYTRFDVYKPHLTIQSFEGPDSVTVDCTGVEIANREDATGTILDGLTIVNSQAGVRLGQYSPAPDSIVRNFVFNGMTNFVRSQGSNITFENNTFMNTAGTPSSNFQLKELANSNIVNNTFTNITAKSGIFYFYSSEATNVTIAGNTFDSTFTGNTFYFRTAGEGNRIYLNNNLAGVALHAGSTAPTTTYWNTTSPVTYTYNGVERTGYLGNHWLDYTGVDTNGDGIGDTPYVLPDGLGTDHAPLMGAWENGVIAGSEPALPYTVLYEGTVDIPAGSTIQAAISSKSGGYTPGEDFVEIPAESVGGMLDASGFIFDMWKSQKPVPTYSLQDITTPDGAYYPNVQNATANLAWRSFDGMTSAATKYDPNVALENGTTIYTVYGDYNVVNSDPSGARYVIVTTLNVVESEPEPATWYVDDDVDAGTDFTNIQDAVSAASSNDTIIVFSGTYGPFSVVGDKSYLTFQALESDGPVMIDNGGSSSLTLRIPSGSTDNAARTIFDGFTFANMTPPFQLGYYGPAPDSIVRNNLIKGTSTMVFQGGATNLTFENNTFVDTRPGTALTSAIQVRDAANSNIVNNTFTNVTTTSGIFYFYSPEATGITIAGNTFDSTFTGNTFYFRTAGEGNRIYLNNNLAGVALHAGSTAPTTTYWNTTSPVTYTYNGVERTGYLGNHWLDYTGVDTNGDGIGDTPYVLPDGLGTDHAPLMGAWENGVIAGSEPALPYTVLYEGTVDIPAGSTIQAAISSKSGGYTPGEDFVEIPAESVGGMLDASGFVFDMWKSQKPVPTYSLQDITTSDGVSYPNVQNATANLAWRSFDGMTSAAKKYDPNVALENGTTIYTVYGDYNVVNSDPSGARYVIVTTLNVVESEPEPATWYVDDDGDADFTTIQAAVDAASAGDTIVVRDGAYTENVLVDRALVLMTENGRENVVVTAAGPTKPVFDLKADGITVRDFTVRGPTNEHVAGIESVGYDDCLIIGNDCGGALYNGIHLGGDATNCTITENYCHDNTRRGISLRDSAHGNYVYNNLCAENGDTQICIKDNANSNFVWTNTFVGAVECLSQNTFNSTEPVAYTYNGADYTGFAGNFWSDYTGEDADGNGIGDTSYTLPGGTDHAPLMGAWEDGVIAVTKPDPIVFNTSVTVYADEPIIVDGTTYDGNTFFNILAAAGYTYTYAESDAGFNDRKPLLTLTMDGVTYPTKDFGPDYAWKFYETLGTGDDVKFKKALNGYIDGSGTYYIWYGDMSQFDWWELPSVENSTYVVELNVTLLPTRPSEDGTPAGVTIISPLPNSGYAVGASVRLAATATGDDLTYTWDLGNGDTAVGQDTSYAYPATGNYTITLTVANDAGSAEASTGITILDSDYPYIVLYEGTVDIPADSTIQAAISPRSGGYTPGEDFVEIPAESVGGMLNASGFIFDLWKSTKPIPTYSLTDITTPDGVYYPNVQDATADLVWRSFDGMTSAATKYDPDVPLANGTTIYTVYGDYDVVNSDPSGAQCVIITTLNIVVTEPGEEADTIILRPGWNFISTPKRLADGANTFALFDGVDTDGRSILLYDGLDYDWKQMGLTDTFRPLDAVWIYANGTYEIPLTFTGGAAELPPTKNLGKGWNAIGFTDTFPESAAATLLSLGDSWATLIGYDAQDQRYERAIIRDTPESRTQEMQPMQGYWIYTTRAETIAAISG